MLHSQKHVFWQALLVTIVIFSLGILMGFILENWRTSKVDQLFKKSEIDLLDARVQNEIYTGKNFDCSLAINENIKFADRIYNEAKTLDRYETASRLSDEIYLEHKKYDILRVLLLLNSMKIKEKCNSTYHEVVYFYNFNEQDINKKAKQNVYSNQLREIKEYKGDKMLLIPIAGNINVSSINLLLDVYDIKESDLPVIVIDGKIKVMDIKKLEDLKKYFE
ncbi:hypothetical protein J4456_05380 [Candidatus Pacearchaeota archaeon]|nr:hypothetical protein [Candidatus Pacearchaeota archaeon]